MQKGKSLWRSVDLRGAKRSLRGGAHRALRAGAVLLAAGACCAVIAASPSLLPRLVYCSAALSSPAAALRTLYEKYSPSESEPAAESSVPARDEPAPEPASEASESTAEPASSSEHEEPGAVPEVPMERRGTVLTKQYAAEAGGIYLPFGAGLIRNNTEHSAAEIDAALQSRSAPRLSAASREVQVLIVHTHATECYEPAHRGYFDLDYVWRSTDDPLNMNAVGEVLAAALSERGIGVLHDSTQHDWPSYNGSYARSAETVRAYLAEYPSIKVVLDLHRDAIEPEEDCIIKPTAMIDGRSAAQIMVTCGCDDGTMDMPDYFSNLRFAAELTDQLESRFPGLTRPVLFTYRKYNMDISPGLLLVEIGATGNTLPEAKYSAQLLAEALWAMAE